MSEPDDRIAALFRAAASDAPPSAFDHDQVVATSRRVTARRRSAALGGVLTLLVVTGVGAAVALPRGSEVPSSAAAPLNAPDGAAESLPNPLSAPGAPDGPGPGDRGTADDGPAAAVPYALPQPVPGIVPLGPGDTECAQRQDPQLRALVEQVLPEVADATEAAVTTECRPGGERGVNLEVDDAGSPGLLTVQYLPPGSDAAADVDGATSPTASGGTVLVSARPGGPGETAPFQGRLDEVASYLAPRL